MSALNQSHQEELHRFLKFFRSRLNTHLGNVEGDFEDTRCDRLSSDDVYSQEEIKVVLTSLCSAVKSNVRSELQDTINMMALLLRQVFSTAEENKLTLELDIGTVEDREMLERVERLSVSEWAAQGLSSSKTKTVSNERSAKQREDEVRLALHTSEKEQEEKNKEIKKLRRQLEKSRDRVAELENTVGEYQQHVTQTKQFQALKQLVAQKNDQLRDARARLQRYERDEDENDMEDDDGKSSD